MNAKADRNASPYHNSSQLPDFRVAMRRAEEARAEQRLKELTLQASASCSAEERIRIWERLHALRLPTSARHPLVSVIAAHTQLSVRAVTDEQQRRDALSHQGIQSHDATT